MDFPKFQILDASLFMTSLHLKIIFKSLLLEPGHSPLFSEKMFLLVVEDYRQLFRSDASEAGYL